MDPLLRINPPRSNLICFAEDDGAAPAGGGGEPPAGNSDSGGAANAEPAATHESEPSGERRPSEQEVERMRQEIRREISDAIWAEARRKYQGREPEQPKAPEKPKEPAPPENSRSEIDELRTELRFEKLAMRHGLTERQTARVLPLYKAANPDDGELFIADLRADGLLPKPTNPSTEKSGDNNVSNNNANGSAEAGSQEGGNKLPSDLGQPRRVQNLEQNGLIDVFSLTGEQIDQMGTEKLVEHYERAKREAQAQSGKPTRQVRQVKR